MAQTGPDPNAPIYPAEHRRYLQTAIKQRTMTNVLLFLIAIPMILAILGGVVSVVACGACGGAMLQGLDAAGRTTPSASSSFP